MLDTPEEVPQIMGKGVVKEPPSKFARSAASKVAGLAMTGLALTGSADALSNRENADHDDNRAIVTFVPAEKSTSTVPSEEPEAASLETAHEGAGLYDTVFHDLTPEQQQEARAWVEDFKQRIAAKPGYEKEHREIPQQYKEMIQQAADAYGLPFEMLYGIIAIENGGGPDITNQISGATGVAQFLPDTARQYGLIVNESQDQRKDPVLSIDAAGRYLRDHKALLGEDAGLTIWSYHAGIGNVYEAMRVYFLDKYHEDIGSYSGAIVANDAQARESVESKAREYMEKDKLDYFKLSSNPAVREQVIAHLDDFSETYVPSVLALIELENERTDQEFDLGGGLKVSVPKGTFSRE